MNKHSTPPWYFQEAGGHATIRNKNGVICFMHPVKFNMPNIYQLTPGDVERNEEIEADRDLIINAPRIAKEHKQMLETLEAVDKWFDTVNPAYGNDLHEFVKAALEAARGTDDG